MYIRPEILIPSLFLSLICVILFLMVWRIESRFSIIFTPFLILMVIELVRVLPGFIYGAVAGIGHDCYPMLIFFMGFVSLIIGFIISLGCLRYRTSLPHIFQGDNIFIKSEGEVFIALCGGVAILVLAGLYIYQGLPSVTNALIGIVFGNDAGEMATSISESRKMLTKGHYFGEAYRGQGSLLILGRLGWPFLVSMASVVYWKTRRKIWLITMLVLFVLSFVFIAGDGKRGPFISSLTVYIILFSLIKRLRMRLIIILSFLILATAVLLGLYSGKMYFMLQQSDFLSVASASIIKRITIDNSINDVYAIEFVRSGIIEHRLGMLHYRDFIAALPGVAGGLPISHEIAQLINPLGAGTTYASGTYITKPYVDFGIIGVIISFLTVGLLGGFIQCLFLKRAEKTPFQLAMGVMIISCTGFIITTSLIDYMVFILVLSIFYIYLSIVAKIYRTMKSISFASLDNSRFIREANKISESD